jgi:phospholipid/cholesterol/gamma-HCH transport system substrate-binding protein
MEPRAHHVLIGLFTVGAVVAAVFFALWLGRNPDRDQRYYTVIFSEAVRGLSVGSAVQYSGIRVGEITSLKLDATDPRRVIARIRIGADVPIKQDTMARLSLVGITGNSVLELSGGTPGSPPLTGPPEGGDPVIVASPSAVNRLLASGEDLLTGITELVGSARAFLSPENAQRLSRTLEKLEQASGAIAQQGDDLQALLRELTAASRQARAALTQASELLANTTSLVDNKGAAALESTQRAMASVERAAANIDRLVAENQGAVGQGAQALNELGPAIRELRETMAGLRVITRRLQDNPTGYLLGRERIKEFAP